MKAFLDKYGAYLACVGTLAVLLLGGWRAHAYLENNYASKSEVKCNEISYQIDKIKRSMWEIEDRYRDRDGRTTGPMSAFDARDYRELVGDLDNWREHQKKWGCEPPKHGG